MDLIRSVLSSHLPDNQATESEFKILQDITPKRFSLPLEKDTDLYADFSNTVGDLRSKGSKVAGVYKFTNKTNGFCYIGSSVQLANRLTHGYLGNRIGKSKISLAIQEFKLDSFDLDIYAIPADLIEGKELSQIKELTLFLEQYYILYYNPEYNVLKLAGSSAGRVLSEENLSKIRRAISARDFNGENNPMFGLSHSKETRAKIALARVGKPIPAEVKAKLYKKVELINTQTKEVIVFPSVIDTVKYIRDLGPEYSKVVTGTLRYNLKNGSLYKGIFKLNYLPGNRALHIDSRQYNAISK